MRIVIKVGTSTLTHSTGNLNIRHVEELCKVMSDLKNAGHEVILVSSGAIGMGVGKLGLSERPKDMPTKQAAAAVGQCKLMNIYEKIFSEYGYTVGQVLLTGDVLHLEHGYEHVRNTVERLLNYGVIPIVNENDTVAVDEIKIGDNDTLSAIVAVIAEADLLVLLSDIDGLYDHDPHQGDAKLLPVVHGVTPEIRAMAGGSVSGVGTGGMITKLDAAEMVNKAGIPMVLTNGADPEKLYAIAEGESIGTLFEVVK
jgi:glutamate 5-kinase